MSSFTKTFIGLGIGLVLAFLFSGQVVLAQGPFGDTCIKHKYWTFNDQFSIWVQDKTMYRCVEVPTADSVLLSARTGDLHGVADDRVSANADALCVGKKRDAIVIHGQLQFKDDSGYGGGFWERECLAFGDVFAANTRRLEGSLFGQDAQSLAPGTISFKGEDLLKRDSSIVGLGVQASDIDITGISKEKDLKTLIVGFTNFLLPYVSVLSVFALVGAGFFYLLSFANEELHTKAKNVLMYILMGIVVIFSAYTIITTIIGVGSQGYV